MRARRSQFAMVPLWVYDHERVTCSVMQVYLAMAALAHDRAARKTLAQIMERCGLGKSAVYGALATLSEIGAVVREGKDKWFMPLDEELAAPNTSATVESDSAHAEGNSATVENPSATVESSLLSRDIPRDLARERAEADAQFEDHFWPTYPERDGKRIGKAKCKVIWRVLSLEDRRAALRGARNLGQAVAAGGRFGIKDPERFLRDRCWEDWQEPAAVERPRLNGSASRPKDEATIATLEEMRAERRRAGAESDRGSLL